MVFIQKVKQNVTGKNLDLERTRHMKMRTWVCCQKRKEKSLPGKISAFAALVRPAPKRRTGERTFFSSLQGDVEKGEERDSLV